MEVLYERYRDDIGIPLDSFLKFFRDAILLHNSWTYGQAATCFFEMASHKPDGMGGTEPVLEYEGFHKACKRYTRQSALVAEVAATMGRPPDGVGQDGIDEWRWTGFTALVGSNLQPEPRSKDDLLLNTWLLSTPIQIAVLESEYAMRRVYRRLCNAPTWHELEIDPKRKAWPLQSPELNCIEAFAKVDFPYRLNSESLFYRGNHRSETGVNSSLEVADGPHHTRRAAIVQKLKFHLETLIICKL